MTALVLARTLTAAAQAAGELGLDDWMMPTRETHLLGRVFDQVVYVRGWRRSPRLLPVHLEGLAARMAYADTPEVEYELEEDRARRSRETLGAMAVLGVQAGLRSAERWLATPEGQAFSELLGPATQRAMAPEPSPFGPSPEEMVQLVETREAEQETRIRSSWWRRAWRWLWAVRP
jgi:hypothetical protein